MALCAAFGRRLALWLGFLRFAALSARLCDTGLSPRTIGCSLALTFRLNIRPIHLSDAGNGLAVGNRGGLAAAKYVANTW